MAITQTDIDNIDQAIIDLSTGAKAVMVTIGGKSIRYTDNSINDLLALRSMYARRLGLVPSRAYAKQGGRGT